MGTTRTIVHAFVLTVAIAAGSVLATDLYVGNELGTESVSAQEAMAQYGSALARSGYDGLAPVGADAPTPPFPPFPNGKYVNPSFNMTDGNAVFGVVIPYLGTWIYENITPNFVDPSLAFRYVTIILNVGYDATAPYSDRATGVYSSITNRPASEFMDSENMNIATIYAMHRIAMAFDSNNAAHWETMLTDSGLSVSDHTYFGNLGFTSSACSDSTQHLSGLASDRAAVAIGNIAAECVIEGRTNDGFNHSLDGILSNDFIDDTGYKPVNTPDNLVDKSRWQPLKWTTVDNIAITQQFVTPQWANTEPYSGIDPRDDRYRVADPINSDYDANPALYEEQARDVVARAASLTDQEKMEAEYFDNKARETLFFPAVEAVPKADKRGLVATNACPPAEFTSQGVPVPYSECLNTRDFWQLDFMLHIAQFDAGIVTWQEKARYDAVRPITAIQYLGNENVLGTVTLHDNRQVSATQWEPYVNTGDHPEYPSATACFCAAQAEAWKLYHNDGISGGSDAIPDLGGYDGWKGTLPPRSSVHEPGVTPKTPVTIEFGTWDEYKKKCANSRVWSGMHFQHAVDESMRVCSEIGKVAYNYFDTLLNGTAELRDAAKALPSDPMLGKALVCR